MFTPKTLVLVRGVSGAGKSTQAFAIKDAAMLMGNTVAHLEADMFFMEEGEYLFDINKLSQAHNWCQKRVNDAMEDGVDTVIVSNTNTTNKELTPYLKMAREHGYRVVSLVVEHRHSGENQHNVPEEVLKAQERRFNLKLR